MKPVDIAGSVRRATVARGRGRRFSELQTGAQAAVATFLRELAEPMDRAIAGRVLLDIGADVMRTESGALAALTRLAKLQGDIAAEMPVKARRKAA